MLLFSVEGRFPGERIVTSAASIRLRFRVEAVSWLSMSRIEIVVNGTVVVSFSVPQGKESLTVARSVRIERSAWIAARIIGPRHRLIVNTPSPVFGGRVETEVLLAHSSPVYVEVKGQQITSAADALFFAEWIERLIGEVREIGVFHDDGRRRKVIRMFKRARDVYRRMMA